MSPTGVTQHHRAATKEQGSHQAVVGLLQKPSMALLWVLLEAEEAAGAAGLADGFFVQHIHCIVPNGFKQSALPAELGARGSSEQAQPDCPRKDSSLLASRRLLDEEPKDFTLPAALQKPLEFPKDEAPQLFTVCFLRLLPGFHLLPAENSDGALGDEGCQFYHPSLQEQLPRVFLPSFPQDKVGCEAPEAETAESVQAWTANTGKTEQRPQTTVMNLIVDLERREIQLSQSASSTSQTTKI
ncbi:hypothetical protein BTVI_27654 [Pitangus sulphuratus]|nr:hypothetical protein BTVI_27654 [Pitangus sulphuratus]